MSDGKREVWVVEEPDGTPLSAHVFSGDAVEYRPADSVRYVPDPEQQAPEQAGWFTSTDQLPEQAQRVLFWATHWDDEWPMSGVFDKQMGWFLGADGCRYKLTGSTIHWAPLPPSPPPKPEGGPL